MSAVSIHSAQFGRQVVLWPSPYQGDLDWCWGWSSNGANGCGQSVLLQLTLLSFSIQRQQLDLLLRMSLPHYRDGAGPQPLNTKRQISCAGGLPPRQGWPSLQPPPEMLLPAGAHALEFAGQPGDLIVYMVCIVSWQEPLPAAYSAAVLQQRRRGSRRNRQGVGWRQGGLLLLLFDTVGRCGDFKGVVELGVIDSEEALFKRHDREEAMTPQDFIFSVRCPCLACHTWDEEKRQSRKIFQIQTGKRQRGDD